VVQTGFDQYVAGLVAGDSDAVVSAMGRHPVLRVAVHDTQFEGSDAVRLVFDGLFDGVMSQLELRRVLVDGDDRVVVFSVRVPGYAGVAEGLNLVHLDQSGTPADVTVFLRPLAALGALAEEMGRRLGGPRPQ